MPNEMNDISLNLARERIGAGLSQEGLANRLGISRQAVSKWERGESIPDLGNLIALADLYGTTVDALIRPSTSEAVETFEKAEESSSDPDPVVRIPIEEPIADAGSDELVAPSAEAPCDPSSAAPPAPTEHDGSALSRLGRAIERLSGHRPTRTTLIVALCCFLIILLTCALIPFALMTAKSRGSATPVAGRASDATGDSRTEYNGRLRVVAQETFDPQEVEGFSFEWYNGTVSIRVGEDSPDDGMIHMRESSTIDLSDDEVMQCRIRNGIVEATTVNAGLLVNAPQHLDIVIPENAAKTFKSVHLGGLASSYSLEGISCGNLDANLNSDDSSLRMSEVTIENLGLGKYGRSDAVLEGDFENIHLYQTSGAIRITSFVQPRSLRANVNAGDLSLTIPHDSTFAVNALISSGAFSCDFERSGTASVYSVDDEKNIEVLCYGRPNITSPLYHITARSSRVSLDPNSETESNRA